MPRRTTFSSLGSEGPARTDRGGAQTPVPRYSQPTGGGLRAPADMMGRPDRRVEEVTLVRFDTRPAGRPFSLAIRYTRTASSSSSDPDFVADFDAREVGRQVRIRRSGESVAGLPGSRHDASRCRAPEPAGVGAVQLRGRGVDLQAERPVDGVGEGEHGASTGLVGRRGPVRRRGASGPPRGWRRRRGGARAPRPRAVRPAGAPPRSG